MENPLSFNTLQTPDNGIRNARVACSSHASGTNKIKNLRPRDTARHALPTAFWALFWALMPPLAYLAFAIRDMSETYDDDQRD